MRADSNNADGGHSAALPLAWLRWSKSAQRSLGRADSSSSFAIRRTEHSRAGR